MIRWREEKECYRVMVSAPVRWGCIALLGLGAILASDAALVLLLEQTETLFAFLMTCLTFLVFNLAAGWWSLARRPHSAWIEIAIRGGRARWGGTSGRRVKDFIDVTAFSCERSEDLGLYVEAHLSDERSLIVFGPWWWPNDRRATRLVRMMNECLCAEAEPPPRLEGSPR